MKIIILSTGVALVLIFGALFLGDSGNDSGADVQGTAPANTVVENGIQKIDILAKGGYSPRKITAKADIPTVLRVKTNGTYDCSTALVIRDIGFRKYLKPDGVEEISIPPQSDGTKMIGTCSMGMYSFEIFFQK
jgi:plastocyanin domain-containing protein